MHTMSVGKTFSKILKASSSRICLLWHLFCILVFSGFDSFTSWCLIWLFLFCIFGNIQKYSLSSGCWINLAWRCTLSPWVVGLDSDFVSTLCLFKLVVQQEWSQENFGREEIRIWSNAWQQNQSIYCWSVALYNISCVLWTLVYYWEKARSVSVADEKTRGLMLLLLFALYKNTVTLLLICFNFKCLTLTWLVMNDLKYSKSGAEVRITWHGEEEERTKLCVDDGVEAEVQRLWLEDDEMRSGVVILSAGRQQQLAGQANHCRPVSMAALSYDEQSWVPGGCHYTHTKDLYHQDQSFFLQYLTKGLSWFNSNKKATVCVM